MRELDASIKWKAWGCGGQGVKKIEGLWTSLEKNKFPVTIPAYFFWVKGVRFLSWECQDFRRDYMTMSEMFRRRWQDIPIPVRGRVFSDPSAWTCFAKHDLNPVVKTLRFRGMNHHLLILHGVFVSHIGLSLHIFGKCVGYGCNNSNFSTRHEKLVRKREFAWDQSFQLTGVRLTPKAWDLAGIGYSRNRLFSLVKRRQKCHHLDKLWLIIIAS